MRKAILGGGLSGLSAAYYLKKLPNQSITLIESSARTGGWIKSNRQSNGVVFEQGPRTIRPRGAPGENTLKLVEELGLSNEVTPILSDSPAAKNRMIYAKGSLHSLPSSLSALFKRQEPFSKPLILHLLNDLKAGRRKVTDESIYDFVNRRFSKEIADYLISPLICGICAGNAKEISVNFLMKNLFEYEQKYGSITNGMVRNLFKRRKLDDNSSGLCMRAKNEKWNIYSFVNGCETLPIALENQIKNDVNILLNTKCKEVVIDGDKVVLLLTDNDIKPVNHLISAIPAVKLGNLIERQHPNLAELLKNLTKNVSVAVVNLHFHQNVVKDPAFGLLVAPKENLPILGIIYDSCCFPKHNNGTTLTAMMGGFWFEEYFGKDPDEDTLLHTALEQLKNILNIDVFPEHYQVNVLRDCLPQYVIGHNENLQRINKYIETYKLPITLCGSSYHGVGINDVIMSAKNAVEKLNKDCLS